MNGYDPTVREYLLSSAEKTIASQDRGGLRLCHTIKNYVARLQSVTTQSGHGFSINAYVSFDDKHRLMICTKVFNVLTFTDVVNAAEAETQTGGHESCFKVKEIILSRRNDHGRITLHMHLSLQSVVTKVCFKNRS